MYKIPASTLFFGKQLVFVPECHSTNTLALELIEQTQIIDGSVVITASQTAGRGQRGNTWETEAGKNLTFSIIVKPMFLAIKDQFFLNIFTSLAIHDFLKDKMNAAICIKWPNDILVNDKKLCGILIENQIRGSQVSNCVIGIGLNINQQEFSSTFATSLTNITTESYDLSAVLESLLACLERRYLQLRSGEYETLRHDYLKQLYWLNETKTFSTNNERFSGTIYGINEDGRLLVQTDNGPISFGLKEINYIHEQQH